MHGEVKERKGFSLIVWYFQCSPSNLLMPTPSTLSLLRHFEHYFDFFFVFLFLMACRYVVISFFYVHTCFPVDAGDMVLSFSVIHHVCQCGVWKTDDLERCANGISSVIDGIECKRKLAVRSYRYPYIYTTFNHLYRYFGVVLHIQKKVKMNRKVFGLKKGLINTSN